MIAIETMMETTYNGNFFSIIFLYFVSSSSNPNENLIERVQ